MTHSVQVAVRQQEYKLTSTYWLIAPPSTFLGPLLPPLWDFSKWTPALSAVSPCKLCAYSLTHRALHLAIKHHYPLTETLEVLNLLAQLPPTDPPLLDILNRKGEVSVTAVLCIWMLPLYRIAIPLAWLRFLSLACGLTCCDMSRGSGWGSTVYLTALSLALVLLLIPFCVDTYRLPL